MFGRHAESRSTAATSRDVAGTAAISSGCGSAYERKKERERERQAALSRKGRDIAPVPDVVDAARRDRCRRDFKIALRTYFPDRFPKPWSRDHILAIDTIQHCAEDGGLFALAMPRGNGKSTIAECCAILVTLYGLHAYVLLLGATKGMAKKQAKSLKTALLSPLLYQDFPEALHALHEMKGIANKCSGQLCHGLPTGIEWSSNRILFPDVELPDGRPNPARGAIIECGGLLEAVRGAKHTRTDGTVVRPTFVLPDDPQTRRSARSAVQCQERLDLLTGDMLFLPGPGQTLSAVMPLTVIEPGDVADTILDRTAHPEWNGLRTKLLLEWPTNLDLWEQYAEILRSALAAVTDGKQDAAFATATEFYRAHRQQMDAGAVVSWTDRFTKREISAIQFAMNCWILNPKSFFSEMQNAPQVDTTGQVEVLPAAAIAAKTRPYKRGRVPLTATCLTAFVDVQKALLYYAVVAWEPSCTGYVIDYGTWPEQRASYFTLKSARRTMQTQLQGASIEAQIRHGLDQLAELLAQPYRREDAAELSLDLLLVDAGWGEHKDTVYTWAREQKPLRHVMPSHGRGVKAGDHPISSWTRKNGERRGLEWIIPPLTGRKGDRVRHVMYDANWWKSFLHQRLATAVGQAGCLTLFEAPAYQHQMLSEHVTAETGTQTQGRGRTVTEWTLPPGTDNHLLDCLVGCCVAASIQGIGLSATSASAPKKKQKFSDLQKQKRAKR